MCRGEASPNAASQNTFTNSRVTQQKKKKKKKRKDDRLTFGEVEKMWGPLFVLMFFIWFLSVCGVYNWIYLNKVSILINYDGKVTTTGER